MKIISDIPVEALELDLRKIVVECRVSANVGDASNGCTGGRTWFFLSCDNGSKIGGGPEMVAAAGVDDTSVVITFASSLDSAVIAGWDEISIVKT